MKKFVLIILVLFIKKSWSQATNPNGYNKFFHENGVVSSEGNMRDGKPDGYWKNYHKNGKIKIEGNRKNFILDSIWKFYDDKARIQKTINYLDGKKNGPTNYYDTLGKLITSETYTNDLVEGNRINFYKSGKIKNIIPFTKGKQNGTAYEYSEDSTITAIIVYTTGILQSYEKMNQKDNEGKKQGIWKEFYDDLSIKKEAKYNDDSLDGYVKDYDKKGNLISTKKFNNGKQILNAPEIANVEVYKETYSDGTLKYEGVYSDGVAIGTHFTYKQKRQCDSSLFLVDDTTTLEKKYVNKLVCRNIPVPDSCIEYFDGTIIAKGAVDSVRNRIGIWKEYHYTGEFKAKGVYKDGHRVGEWEFFYASGKLEQKGKYSKTGKPTGIWKWFYESGNLLRQENYVNGKREGELTDYDEQGKIILKGNYFDNNQEGNWIYETPDYKEIGNYVAGQPDSVWNSYFMPSGKKRFEGRYQNGEPVGLHTYYHSNGKKFVSGSYSNGTKNGDWFFYDELGFLELKIKYDNDIEIAWQGIKIIPTYEQGLRSYNIKLDDNKTQTIKK